MGMRYYTEYSNSQRHHSPGKRATPLSKALTAFGDKKAISPKVAALREMANILTKLVEPFEAYICMTE